MKFKNCILMAIVLGLNNLAIADDSEVVEPNVAVFSKQTTAPFTQAVAGFNSLIKEKLPSAKLSEVSSSDRGREVLQLTIEGQESLVFALGVTPIKESIEQLEYDHLIGTMILSDEALTKKSKDKMVLLDHAMSVQLASIPRIVPTAKRVAVLYNPANNKALVERLTLLAKDIPLQVVPIAINKLSDLPLALKQVKRNSDIILSIPDPTVYSNKTAKSIILFSLRNRIPLIGLSDQWVKAGALYAWDWDYFKLGSHSAQKALSLLDHENQQEPATINYPKSIYMLNQRTAEHMRIKFSEQVVSAAKEIYN